MNCNEIIDFEEYNIRHYDFPIKRSPNLIYDTIVLFRLIIHLIFNRYDIVHSVTPKSGLLLSIAGFLTCSKSRIHTFTGQVWANYTGFKRKVYINIDKLISILNTSLLTDSYSQMNFLINAGVVESNKISVLNKGSITGVDLNRFKPITKSRIFLREQLKITQSDFVIIFIGRLNFDKGIIDLTDAFTKINNKNLHLIIVGPDEYNMISYINNRYLKNEINNLHFIKDTNTPEIYMNMSDLICLPSYREGFGNVIIEAAAVGVPSIVSDIYGLNDAIVDGETGLTFNVGNINDLQKKILLLLNDRSLLLKLSRNSKEFVIKNFNSKDLSMSLHNYYNSISK